MLAKLFTVISHDRDNGLVKAIQLVHTFEQTRHMLVHPPNLAIVEVDVFLEAELFAVACVRQVLVVRIEVVHPQEERRIIRTLLLALQPRDRLLGHRRRADDLVGLRGCAHQRVVDVHKALLQAVLPGQEHVRHDQTGIPACIAQVLGQRVMFAFQAAVHLPTPMRGGVQRSEKAGERRQGPRSRRVRVLKDRCLGSKRIDVGRSGPRVAITAQVIRAQRVDGHDQDVQLLGTLLRAARAYERCSGDQTQCESQSYDRAHGLEGACQLLGTTSSMRGACPRKTEFWWKSWRWSIEGVRSKASLSI